MKKSKKWIYYAIYIALLSIIISGCSSTTEKTDADKDRMVEETKPDKGDTEKLEDLVIHTEYGDLHYPEQWREYISINQESADDNVIVSFETESGNTTYPLFQIIIGNDKDGTIVGGLMDESGTQRNVCLRVYEIPENVDLAEEELSRFYAMQEDLNYLVDNLE